MPRRLVLRLLPLALALLCLSALGRAHAATTADAVVATCTEAGFDAALAIVNTGAGGTLTFACSGTITFSAQKNVAANVMIDGSGQAVILSGGNATRLFSVTFASLDLRNLTLANGLGRTQAVGGTEGAGGAIAVSNGALAVSDVTLRNHSAPGFWGGGAILLTGNSQGALTRAVLRQNGSAGGGALYIDTNASLTLDASQLISNTTFGQYGGAITNRGTLTATATTFAGNTALVDVPAITDESGGALYNYPEGTVALQNVTMTGNRALARGGAIANLGTVRISGGVYSANSSAWGGAVYNQGTLAIAGVTFTANDAPDGAAIFSYAGLTVADSIFSANTGRALYLSGLSTFARTRFVSNPDGAIEYHTSASSTVTESEFAGNGTLQTARGGAIYFTSPGLASGNLTLERVTLRSNRADWGGAIYAYGVTLKVVNSTITQNQATSGAGGIHGEYDGYLTLRNSTVHGNSGGTAAAGVVVPTWYEFTVRNTLIAGNTPKDCIPTVPTQFNTVNTTFSLAGDLSCNFAGAGVQNGVNPQLGPLANNGGFGLTHLPAANSPAVNAGTNTDCPAPDQRGSARPVGAICDIGAVEYNPALIPTSTPTRTPIVTRTGTPVPLGTEVYLPTVQK